MEKEQVSLEDSNTVTVVDFDVEGTSCVVAVGVPGMKTFPCLSR